MKYPWMPLFWGDFLANTMHLSAQEAGAYLFLIAHAWENDGEIPGDRIRLARIGHVRPDQWNRVWNALHHFFEIKAGVPSDGSTYVRQYTHHRVTDELRRLGKISSKRKAAAEQKQSKSYANGGANAVQEHRYPTSKTIKKSSLNGQASKQPPTSTETVEARRAREESNEYRTPPRAKASNVLQPLPEQPKAPRRAKS